VESLNQRSQEFARLKERNQELMAKMKRLSEELDAQLSKRPREELKTTAPEVLEAQLQNEVECLEKMNRVYAKEVSNLKSKAAVKTDYQRIAELQAKVHEIATQNEALVRRKKTLERLIKDTGKRLDKERSQKDQAGPQSEVPSNPKAAGGPPAETPSKLQRSGPRPS
jgi:hypothetical protein